MTARELLPLIQPPDSCTLDSAALSTRVEEWRAALAGATGVEIAKSQAVIALGPTADAAALARLCELETACCSFFTFDLRFSAADRTLTVAVPATKQDELLAFQSLMPTWPAPGSAGDDDGTSPCQA